MLGYIAVGLVLGSIVLLFLDVEVVVRYLEGCEENGFFMEVFYFNRWFKKEYSYRELEFKLGRLLPFVRVEKEVEDDRGQPLYGRVLGKGIMDAWESVRTVKAFKRWLDLHPPIKRLYFRTICVREIKWESGVGAEDAMRTALLAGALWGIKGWALAYVGNHFPLQHAAINVIPQFNQETFWSRFHGMIRLKVAHIILTNMVLKKLG